MKTPRLLVSLGVLTGTLLLSGCMAAMMPAMMLGHGAHKNGGATHEQNVKSCECEKPVVPKTDAQPAVAALSEKSPELPQGGAHKH